MVLWYRNAGRDIDSLRIQPGVNTICCDTSWVLPIGFGIFSCCFVDQITWSFGEQTLAVALEISEYSLEYMRNIVTLRGRYRSGLASLRAFL